MIRPLWIVLLLTIFGFSNTSAQPPEVMTSRDARNALTKVTRKDGSVTAGLFIYLAGDTIALLVGGTPEMIPQDQILSLWIERKSEEVWATLAGISVGAYAGCLLVFRGENQPFAFIDDDQPPGQQILLNAAFAVAGGGLAELLRIAASGAESFDFSGIDDAAGKEWERLSAFVRKSDRQRRIHLSFQGAWVNTYLSESEKNIYSVSHSVPEGGRLNFMRKMQLTYTLFPLFECGAAVAWLGQPSSYWYTSNVSGRIKMSGTGYYAMGIFTPIQNSGARTVQLDIGAGIGLANVDYTSLRYRYMSSLAVPEETKIQKTLFSALLYAELKLFLLDYLSLGVVGDYVYIPEKVPAIDELNSQSRTMGTTSIGFSLGFHF